MRVDVLDRLAEVDALPLGDGQRMIGRIHFDERSQPAGPRVHAALQVQGLGVAGQAVGDQPNIDGSSIRSASFSSSKVGR
jgi:hypothetical protein